MPSKESIGGATTTLFRPVGPAELALIRESDWRRFPPRLPEQPIFNPVLTENYARQIWILESSQGTQIEVASARIDSRVKPEND